MQNTVLSLFHIFRSRGVARNGAFSVMQSIISIMCLFLCYRIVISEAGLSSLGLWSLLITFGGVALIADVSGASALARSVARHDQDHPEAGVAEVIHTVILTSLAINTVMVGLVLLAVPVVVDRWIQPDQQAMARTLIPWVVGTMILTPISLGISSSIDGMQRADQRSILLAAGALLGLIIVWYAVPKIGLEGFAIALFAQQCFGCLFGWLLLRSKVSRLGWIPLRWRKTIFLKTTGYALKLNAIGIFQLLFEPLAKFCINAVGGTFALGLYELSARLIVQVRSLVISATSPLLPTFAAFKNSDQLQLSETLKKSHGFVLYASIAVMFVSLLGAPILSVAMLGKISVELLSTNALLTVGWCLNLFALPLYVAAQGIGKLRWNLASHVVLAACVVLAAILPVTNSSVYGIVSGVVAGLILSTLVTMFGNARTLGQMGSLRAMLGRFGLCAAMISSGCILAWMLAPAWNL